MSPNCLAAPGDCSGINRQRMASLQCKPLWCQFCYSPQRESKMARRRLLTGDERRRLFDPPVQETAIIGHYTLSAEDVELVGRRYGPANRLGLAAQIALMRHPGFGLQPEIGLPDVILQYIAAQLFVDPSSRSDSRRVGKECATTCRSRG